MRGKNGRRREAGAAAQAANALAALVFLFVLAVAAPSRSVFALNHAAAQAAEPLPMTEIAPGVFVFEGAYQLVTPANGGAIANLGFVIGDEAVAVIDSGGSLLQGLRLKAAIRARTAKPVRYVINTHMHPDHVLGNAAFEGESRFVGHERLRAALEARSDFYLERLEQMLGKEAAAGSRIIPPDIAVDGVLTLDLGDRRLTITAHPTAHTDNDITIRDESTDTLFLGDLLFVRHIPALDGSLRGWLAVMDALEKTGAARVVPGHGPPAVPWPQALEPQRRYLTKLRDEIRLKIAAGVRLGEAAETVGLSEQDAWALFCAYNARNVSAGYAELEWE
jgi:quinoprotein relay system zinc metallohydrolase 2